jgi:hypothetical protein
MAYLDYLLYIIVIVLFYILIDKILLNESEGKEGFKHSGDGFIAAKPKKKDELLEEALRPDPQMVMTVKTTYRIAADVAIVIIKMPYQMLSKMVDLAIQFIQNINDMLKPMYAFIQQMFDIVKRLAKQFYNIFMRIFKKGFEILRNLPAFIKQYANIAIGYINTMVNQAINMLTNFFELFQNIFNRMLEIPQQMFNLANQMSTLAFNSFNMMMDIPEKALDKVIGLQGTMMNMLN